MKAKSYNLTSTEVNEFVKKGEQSFSGNSFDKDLRTIVLPVIDKAKFGNNDPYAVFACVFIDTNNEIVKAGTIGFNALRRSHYLTGNRITEIDQLKSLDELSSFDTKILVEGLPISESIFDNFKKLYNGHKAVIFTEELSTVRVGFKDRQRTLEGAKIVEKTPFFDTEEVDEVTYNKLVSDGIKMIYDEKSLPVIQKNASALLQIELDLK